MVLFLICTVPFWTSNIIRMISWIPLLGKEGLINSALIKTHVIDQPLEVLAVERVLGHVQVPAGGWEVLAHSLRSLTHRTEWSWSLRSTSVARERVGWTFCLRFGPLISSQIRVASEIASSWESEA